MSRTSRVQLPPATRFVMIYQPLVARLGLAAAAVFGLLDFLDRAQDQPGRPLATRARLIADLQGIIGKNKVDEALAQLADMGWVKKIERREVRSNIIQWVEFSLNADQINVDLDAGSSGVPIPGTPASLNRDQPGPDLGISPGPELGTPVYKEPESDLKQDLKAASSATASSINHGRRVAAGQKITGMLIEGGDCGLLTDQQGAALANLVHKAWEAAQDSDFDRDVDHVQDFLDRVPFPEPFEDEKLVEDINTCRWPSQLKDIHFNLKRGNEDGIQA